MMLLINFTLLKNRIYMIFQTDSWSQTFQGYNFKQIILFLWWNSSEKKGLKPSNRYEAGK